MATTTNYGWATPDDTSLVKDGASAIRTLGSSIDTTTKNLNPSTTLGDIEYRSSTANTNTRLGIGSTGQILTVAGGVPTWAAAAGGGGKVLQVVTATTTTQVSTSTIQTYIDSGLTASITPTLSSSKILVMTTQNIYIAGAPVADQAAWLRLVRNSTTLATYENALFYNFGGGGGMAGMVNISMIDSPSTTSAVAYKTQFTINKSGAGYAQISSCPSYIILLEIGA
jgi:hypothetical protein